MSTNPLARPNYYLVTSSSFLLAPAIYGLYKGQRQLPLLSLLTTATSVYYWLDPSNKDKRKLDMGISRLCGVVYFLHGVGNVTSMPMRFFGYSNLFLILSAYRYSCSLYEQKKHNLWIPCHIAFHYFSALGKFIVFSE